MSKKNPKEKIQKLSKQIDMYFLLVSTIIIIPTVFSTKTIDPNLAPRLLALGITIFIYSILNIRKPKVERKNFYFVRLIIFPVFGLYFLWSVFSLTQAVNPAEGLFDITKTLLSVVLLVFATQVFIQHKNAISFLVKSVVVASIVATSIGLYQYFVYVPGNSGYDLFMALYEIKGLMAHKNQFAISLFLMLPFTLFGIYKFKKWWWGFSVYSTLMILLNIVILQTRSVWTATLIFMFSFGLLWAIFSLKNSLKNNSGLLRKGLVIGVIFIVVGLGSLLIFQKSGTLKLMKYQVSSIFDAKSHNNQGRLQMWGSTWDLANDHLLFGVGAGNWRIAIIPYYKLNFGVAYQNWRRPHNDFLWVLSEKGIAGLLLYLLLFLMVTIYSIRILLKETDHDKRLLTLLMISGIGGYLIVALFTFPLERINHQAYLMLMIAVIVSMYYKRPAKPKQRINKSYVGIYLATIILAVTSIYYAATLIRSEVYVLKINKIMNQGKQKQIIRYADKAFTKMTTVDHYAMPIHIYKGIANIQLQNYRQAKEDLLIALDYFPTQIAVLSNLAIVSSEMNDSKKAISYLEQSLALHPNYETSLYNMINVYYRDKDYEKAYITLLNCNSKKPNAKYPDYMKALKMRIDAPAK